MQSIPVLDPVDLERGAGWRVTDMVERAAALMLLLAAMPVLAMCAAVLCLISGRSPLIAHRRVGWRGATLWMWKLRTMWDAGSRRGWIEYIDDSRGPLEKRPGDPRVSSGFARFCRRHSIDELPQLWHVVRGEMSLVGPRPMTSGELRRYYREDAEEVLLIKPGLAGLWQVSGRNHLTYAERRALDLRMVRELSADMYLRTLLRVIPEVLSGKNAW